jgi:putative transposase
VAAIKKHESGKKVADICRALAYIRQPFTIRRRSIWGGQQELRTLKELEEENRRLKHIHAQLALDIRS